MSTAGKIVEWRAPAQARQQPWKASDGEGFIRAENYLGDLYFELANVTEGEPKVGARVEFNPVIDPNDEFDREAVQVKVIG